MQIKGKCVREPVVFALIDCNFARKRINGAGTGPSGGSECNTAAPSSNAPKVRNNGNEPAAVSAS